MIYEGKAITVKEIEGGIMQLNFDLQGESVNKFNRQTIEDLKAAVEAIQGQSDVKGVVLTSSKDVFIVGADITEFTDTFKPPDRKSTRLNFQSHHDLVCRLLLEKKKQKTKKTKQTNKNKKQT